ncbi:MAG TPA: phosphoribosyltransferase family protein [Longimicrobiales bacterium]|nr:phosphoribosyltransferase family protein [Longimicrobiales bacterium]
MSVIHALLDLVLAPVCLGCDGLIAPGDTARLVCRRCRSRLRAPPAPVCPRCGAPKRMTGIETDSFTCPECREWPDALRFARSACLLEPPADRLVHQLKYRGWRALGGPLGERMATVRWPAEAHEPAVIAAVPTTARRLRERGYNQAQLLADSLALVTGRDTLPLLRRVSGARTQTALQPAARAANVAGAFAPAADVTGMHVLLVDDVLTTGATAAECAGVLAAAGACCVRLITFVRAFEIRGLTLQ